AGAQRERSAEEALEVIVRGARALGEDEDALAAGERRLAAAEHAEDAGQVPAAQGDVAVEGHVPADEGGVEVLDLAHPLVVEAGGEDGEDVDHRLMVGDEDARPAPGHALAALDGHAG